MRRLLSILFIILVFSYGLNAEKAEGEDIAIEKGKRVSFDYTLTVDGEVMDSSEGRSPLEYTHGEGQIVPGLEKEFEGMRVGDEKNVIVSPEEGYGVLNPDALQEIPRSSLPADATLEAGMSLQARDPNGNVFQVRVAGVKADTVVVDFNHPLAGKTLNFQVKILSIK